MNKKEFKKARKANGNLMDEKADVRKLLQEEFGHELGDVNASKIYEAAAEAASRKNNKKK
ncbi:hypothetical protein ACFOU2_07390 [Bacillus songklensis]|uniref:YfhD-like protein n=1 Tax=Bacillus songklensis TaxID=1069116 RepID=A0ABV8AZF3_9BACI